ncbi:MAG: hypothetical protein IIB64_00195 [Proteobacteria bacterium]|nr:hypothetical protein [Pseudomonadota bacterium]
MGKVILVLLLFLMITQPAMAEATTCKNHPEIVASCYETRGRISFHWAGPPTTVMWKIGTKRILGLAKKLGKDEFIGPKVVENNSGVNIYVFGNFTVCPFTKDKPGFMQFVCIQKAENLRIENYQKDSKNPKITYLKGPFELE